MKFWTCPYCHAHLDIGERCDCQKDKEDEHTTPYDCDDICEQES